jgi:hypothetical protein
VGVSNGFDDEQAKANAPHGAASRTASYQGFEDPAKHVRRYRLAQVVHLKPTT